MTKEKLEKLTKDAVMSELSQNFLDGRELLDFDEVLNVVQAVVKNCSIPDVGLTLCGSFDPDNSTSSGTRCKCGREKWEHPKQRN